MRWRPTTRTVSSNCETPDEAGRLSCTEEVRWRVTAPSGESWPACWPHLATAIDNVAFNYGQPVTVTRENP